MSEFSTIPTPKPEYYKMTHREINKKRGDKKNFQEMMKSFKKLDLNKTRKRKREIEEYTPILKKKSIFVIQSTGKNKNRDSIVDNLDEDFDKITLNTLPYQPKKTKIAKLGGSKNKTKKNKTNSKKS